MKIRYGFISNSSSSSYVLLGTCPSESLKDIFAKVEKPEHLERIKQEMEKEGIEFKEPVYLSQFLYGDTKYQEISANKDIHIFEETSNGNYLPETEYDFIDKDKNIAIHKTEEQQIKEFIKSCATICDFKKWVKLIDDQADGKDNIEEVEKLKRKIVDAWMDLCSYNLSTYYPNEEEDFNNLEKILFNQTFLHAILPSLYPDLQMRFNERIKEFKEEELW